MKSRILCASPLLAFAATALLSAGCDGIGKPSPTEEGAAKIAKVAAEARALTSRLAPVPGVIATTVATDDGTPRDITTPLLAPAAAADELRTLAGRVQAAGTTETQRKDAAALAQRLRREAAMLDLLALEHTFSTMEAVTDVILAELSEASAIAASAGPRTLASAETRVKATRAVLDMLRGQLAVEKVALDAERAELSGVETTVGDAQARANAVEQEAQVLRSEAATSVPSVARPKVDAAVAKSNEARVLRREAGEQEIEAYALRGDVRIGQATATSGAETEEWLATRLTAAERAAAAAKTRADTAMRAVEELRAAAADEMVALQKLAEAEFKPLWEKLKEALDSNPATRSPTDGAVIGIAKARLYQMGAGAVDQAWRLAVAQGAPADAAAPLQAARDAYLAQAKAALVEARDSLSGSATPGGEALLATIEAIAGTLGVDLSTPVAAPAADAGDAPMDNADAPADAGDMPDAGAEGADDDHAPEDEPASPPEEPNK